MSDLFVGTTAVISATMLLPLHGRWVAQCELAEGESITGQQTITDANETFRAVGTVQRGGAFNDRGHVMLVGGADGLATTLTPRFYRRTTARTVARQLLNECNETLSPTSSSRLDADLAQWTRRRERASEALTSLCEHLGLSWRVLLDGTVWLGEESWPTVTLDETPLDQDPSRETALLSFVDLPQSLVPGVTYDGQRVVQVAHVVTADSASTTVTFDPSGRDATDAQSTIDLAREGTGDRHYHALYPAQVVSQDGATLSLIVDPDVPEASREWPPMVGVALRGLGPGITLTVAAGARCLVGFEGGDPSKPFVLPFDTSEGNLTLLQVGSTGAQFVALANLVADALATIRTWANTHVHTGVTVGSGSTAVAATPLAAAASVAATKLKSA